MNYKCLIIDDEAELAQATAEYFNLFDVKTTYVTSSAAYHEFIKDNEAELILLDINLGDGTGFNICKEIRQSSNIPILFISARQSDEDILVALNIGGDDYIKKPYTLSVLLAKVQVTLRRISITEAASASTVDSGNTSPSLQTDDGVFVLHPEKFSVTTDGREVSLKAREFALLRCLVENKGSIVTKEQLFEKVWGNEFFSDGTLNVHIRKLREKLEKNPNEPEHIKTVWGTGYIFE